MTKYKLKDEKSQESLVDGKGMWHAFHDADDSQPADSNVGEKVSAVLSMEVKRASLDHALDVVQSVIPGSSTHTGTTG